MDRSAVEKIVADAAPALAERLGLSGWDIAFGFVALAPFADGRPTGGDCTVSTDYQTALINLNPEALHTESQVLAILRHELFHVVLAPMDLFSDVVAAVDLPPPAKAVLARVLTHACEQAVLALERMWTSVTAPVDAVVVVPIPQPKRKARK